MLEEVSLGHLRWQIETLVGQDITECLYDDLHKSEHRQRVHRFADMLDDPDELAAADRHEAAEGVLLSKRRHMFVNRWLFETLLFYVVGDTDITALPDNIKQCTKSGIQESTKQFLNDYHREVCAFGWMETCQTSNALAILKWFLLRIGIKLTTQCSIEEHNTQCMYVVNNKIYKRFLEYARLQKGVRNKHRTEAAKQMGVERSKMTKQLRFKILKRDGFMCRACGATPREDGVKLHIDHIHPIAYGGKTEESNLQTLCASCNLSKSKQLVYQMLEW